MGLQAHQEDPMGPSDDVLTSIEICAGAGGQAIGLHGAGFKHLALVEIDPHASETLRGNIKSLKEWSWEREYCDVISGDVKDFSPIPPMGIANLTSRRRRNFLASRSPGAILVFWLAVFRAPFLACWEAVGERR